MSKTKYLFKNVGLLTISQFSSNILRFLLVPLYTNILSTEEYGVYGLYSTTISLLLPILTINISAGCLRFALDSSNDKSEVLRVTFKYSFIGAIIISILVLINHIFEIISVLDLYWHYLLLMFVLSVANTVMCNFARGNDNIRSLAISGIMTTAVSLFANVLFLVFLRMGIEGYFLATLVGYLFQTAYLGFALKIWRFCREKSWNQKLEKNMVTYSLPLVLNSVSWWINDASDRYVVTWFCGVAENGIYSVGYKIPSMLNVFQSIFNQAWVLSAVKDYNKEDSSSFFSKVYEYYNAGMVIICSLLILTDKSFARLLYAKDYYVAWKYVPFLIISIVFGAISGYIGGVFSAVKASKAYGASTVIGAISNVIMNLVFVYEIGALGAAIATMISNVIIMCLRLVKLKKYIVLNNNFMRDFISYVLLIFQAIVLIVVENSYIVYLLQCIIVALIIFLFYGTLKKLMSDVKLKLNC